MNNGFQYNPCVNITIVRLRRISTFRVDIDCQRYQIAHLTVFLSRETPNSTTQFRCLLNRSVANDALLAGRLLVAGVRGDCGLLDHIT